MIPEPDYGEEMEKDATRDYPPVTKPEFIVCPGCDGDGAFDAEDGGRYKMGIICGRCHGAGEILNPDLE